VADDRVEWLAPRCGVRLEALPQPGLPALLGGMREGRLNGVIMGIHAGRAAQHQYSKSRHETKVGTGADPGHANPALAIRQRRALTFPA